MCGIKRSGCVELSKYDTVARCVKCRKSLVYVMGTNGNMFKAMIKAFIKRHNESCKGDSRK